MELVLLPQLATRKARKSRVEMGHAPLKYYTIAIEKGADFGELLVIGHTHSDIMS